MENEIMIYATECANYTIEDKGNGKMTLVGYPVVWGAMSDVRRDGNRHRFAKGSVEFETPTRALVEHVTRGATVGTTANGTLRLTSDDKGIRSEIDLPNTTLGRDTHELVKGKYVSGMSIGGSIKQSYAANGVRDLQKFVANEVTITDNPAMAATNITVMSAERAEDYEKSLAATKEHNQEVSKLNKYKLRMYELGKASGSSRAK